MATAAYSGFSYVGDQVTGEINYDTTTFQVVSVTYQNLTSLDAAVVVTNPQQQTSTLTLSANTALTTKPIPNGPTMDVTTGINPKTGLQDTFVNLPSGWSMGSRYPAS